MFTQQSLWYNNMAAVFNKMNPYLKDFSSALIRDGVQIPSTETYKMNIKQVNTLVGSTVSELAQLIKILGNYLANMIMIQ